MTRNLWTVSLVFLLCMTAQGATNVLWTWDPPTNYTGGTAIAPGTPLSYRVEWGRNNWTQDVVVATNLQWISYFDPGTYWHRAAAIAAGVTGLVSDAVSWTWELRPDKPRNWRRK